MFKEALTTPGAGRENDYERLEFYGDSVLGFLVTLELFAMHPDMDEGTLDLERMQRVSNSRLYKLNKEKGFYKYMIAESKRVFMGYEHVGLEEPCHSTAS